MRHPGASTIGSQLLDGNILEDVLGPHKMLSINAISIMAASTSQSETCGILMLAHIKEPLTTE